MKFFGQLLCWISWHLVPDRHYRHEVFRASGPPARESTLFSWFGTCIRCERKVEKIIFYGKSCFFLSSSHGDLADQSGELDPHKLEKSAANSKTNLLIPPIPATTAADIRKRKIDSAESRRVLDEQLTKLLFALLMSYILTTCEEEVNAQDEEIKFTYYADTLAKLIFPYVSGVNKEEMQKSCERCIPTVSQQLRSALAEKGFQVVIPTDVLAGTGPLKITLSWKA